MDRDDFFLLSLSPLFQSHSLFPKFFQRRDRNRAPVEFECTQWRCNRPGEFLEHTGKLRFQAYSQSYRWFNESLSRAEYFTHYTSCFCPPSVRKKYQGNYEEPVKRDHSNYGWRKRTLECIGHTIGKACASYRYRGPYAPGTRIPLAESSACCLDFKFRWTKNEAPRFKWWAGISIGCHKAVW